MRERVSARVCVLFLDMGMQAGHTQILSSVLACHLQFRGGESPGGGPDDGARAQPGGARPLAAQWVRGRDGGARFQGSLSGRVYGCRDGLSEVLILRSGVWRVLDLVSQKIKS